MDRVVRGNKDGISVGYVGFNDRASGGIRGNKCDIGAGICVEIIVGNKGGIGV